ncbi:hypothetical protein niasHS_009305 [Heterodera schachtii]|uniref:Uncharacterized protein n=1 Tax=Heterodera schachtii TaxID=97005 RepID=A0ABD2JBL8_HETSC
MKSTDKIVKNNGDDLVEINFEVDRHCEALKKGQLLDNGISEQFANKVEKALQKHGQKLVEFFKKREIEAKITVDGKCGTIADILARADEHPKLRQIVKMFNILRKWVGKMSAGPDKEAIQNVLLASQTVPMPSGMVQLVIQLWHSSKFGAVPQQLRATKCPSRSRRRRKRQNGGYFSLFGVVMLIISACVASYVVELMKNLLEKGNDFLEFKIVSISITILIYAFIRQQPIFKLGAKFIAERITNVWDNLTDR